MDNDEKFQEVEVGTNAADPVANGGRWVPGQSGNPAGRPVGSRNRATVLLDNLPAGDLEELLGKLTDRAKEGDVRALMFLLGRLVPPCRQRTVELKLHTLDSMNDISKPNSLVVQAVCNGQLTVEEGTDTRWAQSWLSSAAAATLSGLPARRCRAILALSRRWYSSASISSCAPSMQLRVARSSAEESHDCAQRVSATAAATCISPVLTGELKRSRSRGRRPGHSSGGRTGLLYGSAKAIDYTQVSRQ